MSRNLYAVCIAVTLISIGACAEVDSPGPPKNVQVAQEKLAGWMNQFKDATQDQVEQQLGKATLKSTWDLDGQNELLLTYKTSKPETTLAFYFARDRVVTVSLQLLTE
ncbi:MAG: hypothetical protein JSS49_29155 [Planctomycetes bacterium]|nr:hypothetical protein [Planctomycetota bacterium]